MTRFINYNVSKNVQRIQLCGILGLYSPLPGERTAAKIGLKMKKTTKGKLVRLAKLEQYFMVARTVCVPTTVG